MYWLLYPKCDGHFSISPLWTSETHIGENRKLPTFAAFVDHLPIAKRYKCLKGLQELSILRILSTTPASHAESTLLASPLHSQKRITFARRASLADVPKSKSSFADTSLALPLTVNILVLMSSP